MPKRAQYLPQIQWHNCYEETYELEQITLLKRHVEKGISMVKYANQ
jgi:hypothetical protein